ncbi:hypothetical protein AgCh_022771 [Apium graveolens]
MNEANESVTYLGLPNMVGRNKSSVFGFLKEKMKQRVHSWKEHWISQAGREVLIKNVAQALPTYAMSLFLLPIEITKDLERSLSRYWWGIKENNQYGIHWMSWGRLSKHKSKGGIGFRDFRDFNLALPGKQGWRLATQTDRLAGKVYKARYFSDCHFFNSKLGDNPSFIWRSIWEAKSVVMAGARWKGLDNATVNSLMEINGQQWDIEIIEDLFNQRDQQCILNTTIGGIGEVDKLCWNEDLSGEYTVKSAYRLLQVQKGYWHTRDNGSLWKLVWRIKAPPKVLNMVWRALAHCLPTRTVLSAKRVPIPLMCPVCSGVEETIMHALVSCPFADQCWRRRGGVYQSAAGLIFDEWLQKNV